MAALDPLSSLLEDVAPPDVTTSTAAASTPASVREREAWKERKPTGTAAPPTRSGFSARLIYGTCKDVEGYEKVNRIGEGTYGIVYRAKDKATGEIVALKRVRMELEKDGMGITALREIKILKAIQHPNIVRMKDVVVGNLDSVFMCFEYIEHDLAGLMENSPPFSESELKCLMLQLLSGVSYLHDNWIIHRDIKLSNLLYSNQGVLKIADFGMARTYSKPVEPYTPKVVTLWYRSPELLLGCKSYSTAVDIWSVGCIFGELLQHQPLFPGQSHQQQLDLIFNLLGAPSEAIWEGFNTLPLVKQFTIVQQPYNNVREKFQFVTENGQKFLKSLLTYDPRKRLSAREALRDRYFEDRPAAKATSMMPTFPTMHDGFRGRKRHSESPSRGGAADPLDGRGDRLAQAFSRGGGGGGGAGAATGSISKDRRPSDVTVLPAAKRRKL